MPVDRARGRRQPVNVQPPTARVSHPGLHRPPVADAAGQPGRHRHAGAGFEIDSVSVDPPVVTVEGDADELAELDRIDTAPDLGERPVGATDGHGGPGRMPDGVVPLGASDRRS